MAASNVIKVLGDEFLNCAICRSTYKEPKMLPCIHSFCKCCLEECQKAAHQKGDRFGCPICRTSIQLPSGGIGALPTNFLLQSLHDKLGEIETKEVPVPRGRVRVMKPKLTRRVSKTRCSTHTNGLSMYCRTCKSFVCMACTTSNDEHSGHDLVDATEAELDVHETLELQAVLLESVQEHSRCSDTEDRARRALRRVKREAASAEDAIAQRAAEATERVEAAKRSLLSRLRLTEARKVRLIDRVLDSAEKSKSRCKEIEKSVKEAINSELTAEDAEVPKTNAILSQLEELRIELETLELEDSLHGLGLEFEPSDVTTIVGELRDPSMRSESSSVEQNPSESDHDVGLTNGIVVTSTTGDSPPQAVDVVDDDIHFIPINHEQLPEPTLEQSIDALLNDSLQSGSSQLPALECYASHGGEHAFFAGPPPPWLHTAHHPPHHPPYHPHHRLHHPDPRHPFGWHHRGGMGHCRPAGRRGRRGHCR